MAAPLAAIRVLHARYQKRRALQRKNASGPA
jgi:hypothetical protein